MVHDAALMLLLLLLLQASWLAGWLARTPEALFHHRRTKKTNK
jgi:hypothetical protein